MDKQELLNHNEDVIEEIKNLNKRVLEIRLLQHKLKKQIKVPCEFCPYDGLYRCESCVENLYEGFNIKNYPRSL